MAVIPLAVGERSGRDLERICEIPPESIKAAVTTLASRKRPIISPNALRRALEPAVGAVGDDVARVLVRHLISLRLLNARRGRKIDDIVESLTLGLKKKWDKDETDKFHRWLNIKADFTELLGNNHILTTTKAFDLSSDFERILESARIISDIRPVFNDDRTEIIGTIICSTLRLAYTDGDNDKSITIAMDEEDLRNLAKECERALTKIAVGKRFPAEHQDIETFVCGEKIDDFT